MTEVIGTEDVDLICEYADVLQVGARNMQNYPLLRRLARTAKPVLLKRNPAATVEEWLLAAEYLLVGGNPNVILCERGIKGAGLETRNTFDISAVVLARQLTHLPVWPILRMRPAGATWFRRWPAPPWPPEPTACC